MALVIEDGTVVTGANSYVTSAEVIAFALARGISIPEDTDLDGMVVQAKDYVDSFEDQYKGVRVSATQPLAWPRKNVVIFSAKLPEDSIPQRLKDAQCQATIEVFNGAELQPNITGYAVRVEKVDVIQVEYATGGGSNSVAQPEYTPSYTKVIALLKPLFGGVAGLLKVYRA